MEGKTISVQPYYRSRGFQEVEAPRRLDNRQIKMVRSSLSTGRLQSEAESTPWPYAVVSIMPMKNCNDIIENRTRDFPACRAVSKPTAPPHAPFSLKYYCINISFFYILCQTQIHWSNGKPISCCWVKLWWWRTGDWLMIGWWVPGFVNRQTV
jgi:hypothetical protein